MLVQFTFGGVVVLVFKQISLDVLASNERVKLR
jgi:hypothetical protein